MPSTRLRHYQLRDVLLPLDLRVVVGDGPTYVRWFNRRFHIEQDDRPLGAGRAAVMPAAEGVGYECLIWLPYFRRGNAFDAGVLAHEALHITWRLLEKLGIFDEEAHCYMMQWIITEATHRLHNRKV